MRIALAILLTLTSCRDKQPKAPERHPDAAPVAAPSTKIDAAPPVSTADDRWRAGNALYAAGDHPGAASLFDSACNSGHPVACEDRSALYEKGEGGPPDKARALELRRTAIRLYQEQCAAGAPASCKELSWWLGTGGYAWDTSLLPGNRARAVELYRRAADLWLAACERGDGESCLELESWIAEGFGFASYAKRVATELRRRHSKESLIRRSCDGDHAIGCYQLVQMTASRAEGIALLRKSCDGGYHGGCRSLGVALEDGLGIARDQRQALRLYLRGCDLDVGVCFEACRLGDDIHTAQPAACKKACDAGYWPSACGMGR